MPTRTKHPTTVFSKNGACTNLEKRQLKACFHYANINPYFSNLKRDNRILDNSSFVEISRCFAAWSAAALASRSDRLPPLPDALESESESDELPSSDELDELDDLKTSSTFSGCFFASFSAKKTEIYSRRFLTEEAFTNLLVSSLPVLISNLAWRGSLCRAHARP